MFRRAALFLPCAIVACGPSPAYEPAHPSPAEARCQRGDTVYLSARGIQNGTGRPYADVERLVRAALEKHVATRHDTALSSGAHIDGRCELDVSLSLDPFDRPPGKVVIHGTANVVANGSRSNRGSLDKKLTAEVGPDNTKETEDLLLVKSIDLLVGTVVANLRAFADGDPDAMQGPPR